MHPSDQRFLFWTLGILGSPFLLWFLIWLAIDLSTSPQEKAAKKAAEVAALKQGIENYNQNRCEDETIAFVMTQNYVEAKLKSPATADFASIVNTKVQYIGNCTHEVNSYVDAQNAFGAKIRTKYYAKIKNEKGTDKWALLDLQFSE